MIYKAFQNIELSCLGMGNMRLPVHTDKVGNPIDREKAQEIIDYAISHGINYFDTAYIYHGGESEKFLGDALAKYPRESYHLATKYIKFASDDYKAVFEEQLARLQTDYIDFYLIHSVSDDSFQAYMDCGCIEYFEEQQKKGRIHYFGFSSHASPSILEKFADLRKWDFAQIQLNYYDWAYGTAKTEYEILEKRGIPIVVMEPVRGGRLATLSGEAEKILKHAHPDWTLPSWAFKFIKTLPQVQVVLSGMSTLEQISENAVTFENAASLDEQERKILMTACEAFRKEMQVPCTGCRYCCDGCPAQIDIPAVLELYNRYKLEGSWALNDLKNINSKGKPQDCIGCGACGNHCPQSIDIPAIMQELASKGQR